MGLETVVRGKRRKPPRIVIYGTEGVGKSSLVASIPDVVMIPTEDGLGEIDCASFDLCRTLGSVIDALESLLREEHDFAAVGLDSLDWLERLVWDALCQKYGVDSIEKIDGGYGRGYSYALDGWREVLRLLDALRDQRGMLVALIAHSKVESFNDPDGPNYDRYSPRLHKAASGLVTEWADAVLFAAYRMRVATKKDGFGKETNKASPVGEGGGERIIRAVGRPAAFAKNRYGMPETLPLQWSALAAAMGLS